MRELLRFLWMFPRTFHVRVCDHRHRVSSLYRPRSGEPRIRASTALNHKALLSRSNKQGREFNKKDSWGIIFSLLWFNDRIWVFCLIENRNIYINSVNRKMKSNCPKPSVTLSKWKYNKQKLLFLCWTNSGKPIGPRPQKLYRQSN